ncbi:MAG TPA: hypothetical protein DCP91_05390 [Eggerthellaceae bacterium]|nr:hypothetical protein [Eggerthellaceae bacterium]
MLLGEIGVLKQLVDGFTAYGVSKATEASAGFYIAWRVVLGASAFFGVANLLGFSALGVRELKCVFQPLDAVGEPGGANADDELSGVTSSGTGGAQGAIAGPDERAAGVVAGAGGERPIVKRFAAVAAVLPLCLVVAFLVAESTAASAAATQEYSAAEAFARDQVGIAVYVLDGKYYEQQAVQELVDTANARSQALFEDARATLVPLVNESYDARIANVDAYLDWYYSLPADYERLGRLITGTVEGYMQDQFESRIEAGIDDSRLSAELERVIAQAEAIQADLAGGLASHEVTGVPDWLMTAREAADLSALTLPSEPTRKLLGAAERFGVSAAAGAAAGIVAKRLVRRALAKPFFSKIVARVTSALASKGIGAGIGAAAGSAVGPLGTIAGAAAGVAAGLGVDYGLLKIDELQNREEYRSEIIAAIEEERAEMLAVVGA